MNPLYKALASLVLFIPFVVFPQNSQHSTIQLSSGSATNSRALIQQMVNSVSSDNLVNTIGRLQAFGTRYETAPQQEAAADWITRELAWWGLKADSYPYMFSTQTFTDIHITDQLNSWASTYYSIQTTTDGWKTAIDRTPKFTGSHSFYAMDFTGPLNGVVVGYPGLIMRTTDGGLQWTQSNSGVTATLRDVSFANHNLGIAVGDKTILRTIDAGVTWTHADVSTSETLINVKVLDSLNMWVAGSYGIMLHSSDGGVNWIRQSTSDYGLYAIDFVNPRLGWTAGLEGVMLRTSDGGEHWKRINRDDPSELWGSNIMSICYADSLNGWMGDFFGGISRTTDGGQSWTRTMAASSFGWNSFQKIKHFQKSYLIAAGGHGNFVTSSDGGTTWANHSGILPPNYFHSSRNIVVTIPGVVTPEKECVLIAHYDCASNDPLVCAPGADDNGSGTSAVMEAAHILARYRFESTIKLILASAEESGTMGSGAYAYQAKSENRNIIGVVNGDMIGYPVLGDTTRLALGSYLGQRRLVDSVLVYNNRYKIGARLDAFMDSTGASDHGPFGEAGYDVVDVAEGTPQEIWAGLNPFYHTTRDSLNKLHPGLMRRAAQLMIATVAELAKPVGYAGSSQIPTALILEQNFPNPFNPATTFRFKIPQSSHVKLRVYDLLGEEVATVMESDLEAGSYSVPWRPQRLSSGMYFYQLQSGGISETKKFVLLK